VTKTPCSPYISGVPPASTPCIQVCVLDPDSGLCLGCGRTIEELARWSAMTEAERKRIMAELPSRRAAGSSRKAGRA